MGAWNRLVCMVFFLAPGLIAATAAEPNPLPLLHYALDGWDKNGGLPLNTVRQVLPARDGYLWLATDVGLVRFDGVRFTLFDAAHEPAFASDFVNVLVEDREGAIWIGLHGGLVRWRAGRFSAIPLNGLSDDNVQALAVDQGGSLWLATHSDLAVFRDERLVPVSERPLGAAGALALLPSRDGSLWVVSSGLARIKDGKTILRLSAGEFPAGPSVLEEDWEGKLWVGTPQGDLGTLRDGRFHSEKPVGLPAGPIGSLHAARDGSLWIGILGGGLHRFRDGRLESLTTREGLRSDDITSIESDADGNIWFSTNAGGLHCLRRTAVTVVSQREGLSHRNVLSVFEDSRKELWVGTSGGDFNRIRGGRIDRFGPAEGLNPPAVLSMAEQNGVLWVGTGGGGLFRFDGRRFVSLNRPAAEIGTVVMTLLTARDGRLWLGSEFGLKKKEGARFVNVPFRNAEGQEVAPFVISLAEGADGTIWVGTQGLGLFRVTNGPRGTEGRAVGLGSLVVVALRAEPDGSLWIGTAGEGLLRWREGRIDRFRRRDGLPDDMVFSIEADAQGRFWLSGNAGIFRVDRSALEAFADHRTASIPAIVYGALQGLRAGECTGGGQNAGWSLTDGRVAFATPDGLALVDPGQRTGLSDPPRVLIESLTCDQRPARFDSEKRRTIVPKGAQECQIAFSGFPAAGGAGLEFRYRLRGFHADWQEAGRRRVAFFTGLAPGDYSLEVEARNNEGVLSRNPAVFAFRVEPRYFETRWFRGAVLLGLVAVGYLALRQRTRQLLRRQQQLERLVAERTAEIAEANRTLEARVAEGISQLREADRMAAYGTLVAGVAHEVRHPIFAIQMAAYVLQKELAGQKAVGDQLRVLDQETRRMTALTDDLVEFARPAAIDKAPADVEPLLHEAAASFKAEHPASKTVIEIISSGPLPQVLLDRARIVQVLVNLMENAQKHARNLTRIGLSARLENGWCLLEVANDGAPIPPAAQPRLFEPFFTTGQGTGLGLSIVKRVVEQHGGRIRVLSTPTEGTRFTISLLIESPTP